MPVASVDRDIERPDQACREETLVDRHPTKVWTLLTHVVHRNAEESSTAYPWHQKAPARGGMTQLRACKAQCINSVRDQPGSPTSEVVPVPERLGVSTTDEPLDECDSAIGS